MEYKPFLDAFKYSLVAPTELQDRWNELDSCVYVISKTVFLDEMKNQQPTQIFKIGTSTLSGQIQMNARSFLIQFIKFTCLSVTNVNHQ